jgi:hypothetical protein
MKGLEEENAQDIGKPMYNSLKDKLKRVEPLKSL